MSYTCLFIEFSWILAFFTLIIIAVLLIMSITLWELHSRHKNPKSSKITKNIEKINKKTFTHRHINEIFEHYFSNSNIGFLVYDDNLSLSSFNDVFASIVGFTKDQFLLSVGGNLGNILITTSENSEILKKIKNRDTFKTVTSIKNATGDIVNYCSVRLRFFRKLNS